MTPEAESFISMQQSPATVRAYRQDLTRWFQFSAGQPVDEALAVAFKQSLAGLAPASAARIFTTVRSFYQWLHRTGTIASSPFQWVKPPKRIRDTTPDVPSDEDVERLIAATEPGSRRRTVIALLLNGLRAGEVCGATLADMKWEPEYGRYLRIVGKGMKERLVPMTLEAEQAVSAFNRRGIWLVDDEGQQLNVRQVEHDVYKAAEYAGIKGMHPHALRHHYATRLTRNGVGVLHLQKLLGHDRAETTQRYVTLDLGDLVAASKLDPRNRQGVASLRSVA